MTEPAPGEEISVALALVNTRTLGPRGVVESIPGAETFGSWLSEHGMPVEVASIRKADVAAVQSLRTAVRAVFEAAAAGIIPPPSAVEAVNAFSAAAPGAPQLAIGNNTVGRGWAPTPTTTTAALSGIARDAIDMAVSPMATRLRTCAAGDCIRMFSPDRASRVWCSTTCGDRVRAARHYARRQSSQSAAEPWALDAFDRRRANPSPDAERSNS